MVILNGHFYNSGRMFATVSVHFWSLKAWTAETRRRREQTRFIINRKPCRCEFICTMSAYTGTCVRINSHPHYSVTPTKFRFSLRLRVSAVQAFDFSFLKCQKMTISRNQMYT